MVKCEICGEETENPKKFGEKTLCEDCYVEIEMEESSRCVC
jgi:formylmethanofuran dehydrogenase subunit E